MMVMALSYSLMEGYMKLDNLQGIIPNRRACFDLLVLLENEYNCSIKLWLDANNPRGGEIGWTIYCAGSGGIWDNSDLDCFMGKARVLDADGGNIYPALWSCLLQLESRFKTFPQFDTLTTAL